MRATFWRRTAPSPGGSRAAMIGTAAQPIRMASRRASAMRGSAKVFGDLDGFVDAAQEFQFRGLKAQIEALRWETAICRLRHHRTQRHAMGGERADGRPQQPAPLRRAACRLADAVARARANAANRGRLRRAVRGRAAPRRPAAAAAGRAHRVAMSGTVGFDRDAASSPPTIALVAPRASSTGAGGARARGCRRRRERACRATAWSFASPPACADAPASGAARRRGGGDAGGAALAECRR